MDEKCSFIDGSQRVTLVIAFAFPFWKGGGNLRMKFRLSVTAVWELVGGGDIRTLTAVIKFIWTFCTLRQRGHQNIALTHSSFLAPESPSKTFAT